MERDTQEPQNPIESAGSSDQATTDAARSDALREEVEKEAAVFRDCLRAQYACVYATLLMLGASALAFAYNTPLLAVPLFCLYLVMTAAAIVRIHRLTIRGTHAIREMTRHERLDTIGVFVDLLEHTDFPVQLLVGEVLTALLPRLRATDAALLHDRRRAILNRRLRMSRANAELPLLLAILSAWEQIGDINAIGPVERLTQGYVYTKSQRTLSQAAEACLPALREQAEHNRLRTTLLRPSTDPDTPSETLLRPAVGSDSQPGVLLRPSNREETQ